MCFACRFERKKRCIRLAASGPSAAIFCQQGFVLSAPVRWVRRRRLTARGLPHPESRFRYLPTTRRQNADDGSGDGGVGRGGREHHRTLAYPALHTQPQPIRVTRPTQPLRDDASLEAAIHTHIIRLQMFLGFTPGVGEALSGACVPSCCISVRRTPEGASTQSAGNGQV
jgi:hypothetical protein